MQPDALPVPLPTSLLEGASRRRSGVRALRTPSGVDGETPVARAEEKRRLPADLRMLPRKLGRYTLFDHIGRGGMADIYLAQASTELGASRLVVIRRCSRRSRGARSSPRCWWARPSSPRTSRTPTSSRWRISGARTSRSTSPWSTWRDRSPRAPPRLRSPQARAPGGVLAADRHRGAQGGSTMRTAPAATTARASASCTATSRPPTCS